MGKMKGRLGNDFCPQPLFLYGNYQADGTPHFGLFCWFSYCSLQDGEEEALGVMACIGEEKLTKDLIKSGHPPAFAACRLLRHHFRPGVSG